MEQILHDDSLERAILSSVMFNPDIFGDLHSSIAAKDFYHPAHGDIFRAMSACFERNEPVEIPFIKKYLGDRYNEALFSAIMLVNPIVDLGFYVSELKEKSIKRALNKIASEIPAKVAQPTPSRDIVDSISSELYALVDGGEGGMMKDSLQIVNETINELNRQKELANKEIIGLDTGFKELNRRTKGFKNGELIIIAARPGMGKTAFALNLVNKTLNEGRGVVFFSLEMPASQLMLRILSAKTSINLQNLMVGDMTNDQISRLSDACDEMSNKKFFVYDSGAATIHTIKTQLKKFKAAHEEINLCVIDYIGLMTDSGGFKDRHLQIAEISRSLKLLARELNIPIIALSQLNRSLESRANKRPMLSDLRESGAIEQDADTILFVYRNDYYLEQAEKELEQKAKMEGKEYKSKISFNKVDEAAEIIIGKNRNGPTGHVDVTFQKEFTRFVDYSQKEANSVATTEPQSVEFNPK